MNLLTRLRVAQNSLLFAKDGTLNEKTGRKILKCRYAKNKVLYNLYSGFVENGGKANEFSSKKVIFPTLFIQEKSVTQRGDILHTKDRPMQLIHADVVDLHFFSKSAVGSKYCLASVEVFTSKTYTCGMKKKHQLSTKLEKFYS